MNFGAVADRRERWRISVFSRFFLHLSARKLALLVLCLALSMRTALGQQAAVREGETAPATAALARVSAIRATRPPVIDGRDDDEAWKTASVISGFRVFDPKEDGEPTFKTEARITYDAEYLYVFTRMFDPH